MPVTVRPIRWFSLAACAASIALAGCGGASAPESVAADPTNNALAPASPIIPLAPVTGEASGPIAASEPSVPQDRPVLDAAAAQVKHDVEQTTGAVNQAVGEAQTQAKQAATGATDGVKEFTNELQNDATQAVNGAVSQAKASAQGAAAGVKQQVQTAVDGAKGNVRRRARAAADAAAKQAEDAGTKALDGLLGPAPKN